MTLPELILYVRQLTDDAIVDFNRGAHQAAVSELAYIANKILKELLEITLALPSDEDEDDDQ